MKSEVRSDNPGASESCHPIKARYLVFLVQHGQHHDIRRENPQKSQNLRIEKNRARPIFTDGNHGKPISIDNHVVLRMTCMNTKAYSYIFIIFAIFAPNLVYAEDVSFESLLGKWRTNKTHSSGALITVEVELKPNKEFYATAYINGVASGRFNGVFALKGNELIWTYLDSSIPIPVNYKDTDVILSIEKDKYTYRSTLTGETGWYERIN